jgi:signal transduction histidine kinase
VVPLLPGDVGEPVDAVSGPPASPAGADGRAVSLVQRNGVPLAQVRHAVGAGAAVDDVLARAGLAFEIARLQTEVRHRLAEVQASRARIVAAGYEERRRLERDLHDGAQQRLVAVGLALRHVQHELDPGPAGRELDAAVAELGAAVAELRELAHGVRPAPLAEGLAMALRELAGRTPLPVRVEADPLDVPADVEATAYFVACEALTNAAKHSGATTVDLRAVRDADDLVLSVDDDGAGGAVTNGHGLRGLSDRVAAQGGRFELHSPPGGGTRLTVRLPCAS